MIDNDNGLSYFFGVVENRNDPTKQGRVQVRVIGYHPIQRVQDDVSGLPTEDLPWYNVLLPITSASISGVGFSPVGPVEGTHVYGHFLDKYKQSAIVLGTYAGNYSEMPDFNKGFSDPNGVYPKGIGSDVNLLSQGGEEGQKSPSILTQNNNTAIAPNPDDTSLEDVPEDNDPNFTIEKMLKGDEGLRLDVYWDTEGYPTIGIGHLILYKKTRNMQEINSELSKMVGRTVTNGRITNAESSKLFQNDIARTINGIKSHHTLGGIYNKMNRSRQMAMENMAFQMGVGGLAKFHKTLAFMDNEEWQNAYYNLRQSRWANQTAGRSQRVSRIILVGNLESYGVKVDSNIRRMSMDARIVDIDDPESPYIPEDSRLMFEEPKSPYRGEYPYNKSYQSESGIIQEFDDTPNNERYRLYHPTGSYDETRANGTKVTKIVGDGYYIVDANDHILIGGNKKVVVSGDCQVYVMGNSTITTDGNVTSYTRGNHVSTVEGELKATIFKNADIEIKQDAYITVEQNLEATVNDSATINVENDATINAKDINVTATDTMEFNADNINFQAKNSFIVDGGNLAKITAGNVQVG